MLSMNDMKKAVDNGDLGGGSEIEFLRFNGKTGELTTKDKVDISDRVFSVLEVVSSRVWYDKQSNTVKCKSHFGERPSRAFEQVAPCFKQSAEDITNYLGTYHERRPKFKVLDSAAKIKEVVDGVVENNKCAKCVYTTNYGALVEVCPAARTQFGDFENKKGPCKARATLLLYSHDTGKINILEVGGGNWLDRDAALYQFCVTQLQAGKAPYASKIKLSGVSNGAYFSLGVEKVGDNDDELTARMEQLATEANQKYASWDMTDEEREQKRKEWEAKKAEADSAPSPEGEPSYGDEDIPF